jgi:4-hydroxythreonine-4-phosphate dehydrogenase
VAAPAARPCLRRKPPRREMMLPRIAVTSGEPAGIGPELCLRLAHHGGRSRSFSATAACSPNAPQPSASMSFSVILTRKTLSTLAGWMFCTFRSRAPSVAGGSMPANGALRAGAARPRAGRLRSGEFAAMVTAPVHKGVINEAGVHFTGHTEYLAEKTGTPLVVMMLAGSTERGLAARRAGHHAPAAEGGAGGDHARMLERRCASCTPTCVGNTALPRRASWSPASTRTPAKAAISGARRSSHHAGARRLRAEGMRLSGPLPADTMFVPPVLAAGRRVLAMYHDQGLTVLKYATFGHGINVTLGLPIIRTSVDHGTALDLAGSGRADRAACSRRSPKRRAWPPKGSADHERPPSPASASARTSWSMAASSAAIVSAIDPQRGDTVVEIGPGLGAMTEPLLARSITCMCRDRPRPDRPPEKAASPRAHGDSRRRCPGLRFRQYRQGPAPGRQSAVQHLDAAALSSGQLRRCRSRHAFHAAEGGGRAHGRRARRVPISAGFR